MNEPTLSAENGLNIPFIYVIIAYRWNDQERHSYLVAANFDKDTAIKIAEEECICRAGKYSVRVYQCKPSHTIVYGRNPAFADQPYHEDDYVPPYYLDDFEKLIHTAFGHTFKKNG